MASKHVMVIDAVSFTGDVAALIVAVQRYVDERYPAAKTIWIVRADQLQSIPLAEGRTSQVHQDGATVSASVTQCVQELLSVPRARPIVNVFSHDKTVLADVTVFNSASATVATTNISNATGVPRSVPSAPPPPPELSESDVHETKVALFHLGHTSPESPIKVSSLRVAINNHDRRFETSIHPLGQKLTKMLVEHGVRNGWLTGRPSNSSTPDTVWLSDRVVSDLARSLRQGPAVPTAESPVASATPVQVMSLTISEMEGLLSRDRIGSPVTSRRALFDAVENAIAAEPAGMIVADLIGVARARAGAVAPRTDDPDGRKLLNITECFFNMLIGAEVLLDAEGRPIPLIIGTYSSTVRELAHDFRVRAEGFLVRHIIKKLDGLSTDDLPMLARVIYHEGRNSEPIEIMKKSLDEVLRYLVDAGAIQLSEDNRFIRLAKPSAVALADELVDSAPIQTNGEAKSVEVGRATN